MKVIILDTETTGLVEPQPCEIAYFSSCDELKQLRFNLENIKNIFGNSLANLEVTDYFLQRFKPLKSMEVGASKVNGIYNEHLKDKPCLRTFEFPETVNYLIGHNIAFDKRALNWDLTKPTVKEHVKLICTKELSQLVFEGQRNNKLTTLIEFLYPEHSEALLKEAHTALQDCKLTYLVLFKVLEKLPQITTWEQLANLCSQGKKSDKKPEKPLKKITKMPFGRYKDQLLVEIPSSYLTWCLDNMTLQPNLKLAIEEILNG